jgi:hypothetical protein
VLDLAAHVLTLPRQRSGLTSAEKSALEWAQCMPWSANVCTAAIHEERTRQLFTVTANEVEQGASVLFALVQDSLRWMREVGYGKTTEQPLLQLWTLQQLASEAVAAVCQGARRTAKSLQMKAAAGEPLTVWVGELTPERLPYLGDILDPSGRD